MVLEETALMMIHKLGFVYKGHGETVIMKDLLGALLKKKLIMEDIEEGEEIYRLTREGKLRIIKKVLKM